MLHAKFQDHRTFGSGEEVCMFLCHINGGGGGGGGGGGCDYE